jgi:hypothetical protein
MATYNLRSFARAEDLKCIAPARLIRFLTPYRAFFSARGVTLPVLTPDETPERLAAQIDYDGLIQIFLSPDEPEPKAPIDLINSMCVIDELATPGGMDALVSGAAEASVKLTHTEDQSPIDVAVEAWLADPEFTQNKHAEQHLHHPRSFEYFPRAAGKRVVPRECDEKIRQSIEKDLDDWFHKHRRGRDSRIFMFTHDGVTWFLIRHGQPLRREGSLDNGKPSSVVYRPERFDVVAHDHTLDELRMNAQSKGEKTLYRQVFGKHLFGESAYFGTAAKYTLDPIRVNKRKCLACEDIPGVEWINLREVQFLWGGDVQHIEIRKATDVFAAYEAMKRQMPQAPKIINSRFEMKFRDSDKTRMVSVNAHKTQCLRDPDTVLIEAWLMARGFTSLPDTADAVGDAVQEVLVDSGVVAGVEGKLRRMGMAIGIGVPGDLPAPAKDRATGDRVAKPRSVSGR